MKPNLTPVKMRSPVQLQEIERKLDKIIELLQRIEMIHPPKRDWTGA